MFQGFKGPLLSSSHSHRGITSASRRDTLFHDSAIVASKGSLNCVKEDILIEKEKTRLQTCALWFDQNLLIGMTFKTNVFS